MKGVDERNGRWKKAMGDNWGEEPALNVRGVMLSRTGLSPKKKKSSLAKKLAGNNELQS